MGLICLFSAIDVWSGSGWKVPQKYPANAGVPRGSILGYISFLLYTNDLPNGVVFNIAMYGDNITIYSKSDKASRLLHKLELAFEIESDL